MEIHQSHNELDTRVIQLSNLMYGHNYQVSMGMEELQAADLETCRTQLLGLFPAFAPGEKEIMPIDSNDWLMKAWGCFEYRGDSGAGLELSFKDEKRLRVLQAEFLSDLKEATAGTHVYFCESQEGLPTYPVFWDFCLLFIGGSKSWFVYGAASD